MTEFSRRVDVEIIKDEPKSREAFAAETGCTCPIGSPCPMHVDKADGTLDTDYERYLHYFQPYRWHAQGANNKIVTDGESYHNEADAINAVELLFGDDTTMYWAPTFGEDRGNRLLRYGKTDREHQAQ
jgi:uncharacterized protein YegP (UPF0339 family)